MARVKLRNNADSARYSEAIAKYEIPAREEKDGVNVPAQPVFLIDPTIDPITVAEILRNPTIFRMATANAVGQVVLWDPAANKRFRLMGFSAYIPSTATSVGGSIVTLQEAAANIFYVAAIGATTGGSWQTINLPGNGYLAVALNAILYINLTAAFTAGAVYINAWGREE